MLPSAKIEAANLPRVPGATFDSNVPAIGTGAGAYLAAQMRLGSGRIGQYVRHVVCGTRSLI